MYDNIRRKTEKNIHQMLADELGPAYVAYREAWNAVTVDLIPAYPLHIDFELRDTCNQRCRMCPRNDEMHPDINYTLNSKSTLSFFDYCRIIDEGRSKGLRSVNLGAFAEPLIHKEAFAMVDYARRNGVIDTRLITNGLLLDRHVSDVFDSGLVNLFVSVDAYHPETYLKLRGQGFEKVKDGLLKVLEERRRRGVVLPIVRVSLVDMKDNREEIDDFIKYWETRVDFIDIQVYDDFNVNINAPFDFSRPKKWDCRSPFCRLSVLSDGRVLPCCNFFGENIPIGNIFSDSIETIWNSRLIRDVRAGLLDESLRNCAICQRIC